MAEEAELRMIRRQQGEEPAEGGVVVRDEEGEEVRQEQDEEMGGANQFDQPHGRW